MKTKGTNKTNKKQKEDLNKVSDISVREVLSVKEMQSDQGGHVQKIQNGCYFCVPNIESKH